MYLSHPTHPPTTTDSPLNCLIHHINVDDSNHNLEVSMPQNGPTKPFKCIKAELGKSDAPNTMYMDWRWSRSDPIVQYMKMDPLESIEVNMHAPVSGQHSKPQFTISGNCSSTTLSGCNTHLHTHFGLNYHSFNGLLK